MTTFTIQQKQSNTGSIYDLASDQYDRVINFGDKYRFAVVLPAYYNAKVTRHITAELAIKMYKQLIKQGYQGVTIINDKGEEMIENEGWEWYESLSNTNRIVR